MLEILLGIAIGPQVLGWAEVDEPVTVMSMFGLAFLLLLAGLEIDFERLRGRLLRLTLIGYAVSFGIAIVVGFGLRAGDLVKSPLLVAIILSATGLGVILPILKDAGETSTPFGQVVVAGASIAEVGPIILLSLFFSGESGGLGSKLALLIAFFVFVVAAGFVDPRTRALDEASRRRCCGCRTRPPRSASAARSCCSPSSSSSPRSSGSRRSSAPSWRAPR